MIIAFLNRKGGSGKTTTTVNLAAAMVSMGKKVLVIDMDAQCNASGYVGTKEWSKDNPELGKSIYDLFFLGADIRSLVHETAVKNLYCIPSSEMMMNASTRLTVTSNTDQSGRLFAEIKKHNLREDYDYIFLDCAPFIDHITINALNASDYCVIPAFADGFNMDGIIETLKSIDISAANGIGTEVKLLGILLCHYRSNTGLAKRVAAEVREALPDDVFETTIRMSTSVGVSLTEIHKPVAIAFPKDKVTAEYSMLAREIIEKIGG